jgi:hypothetical protein
VENGSMELLYLNKGNVFSLSTVYLILDSGRFMLHSLSLASLF